MAVAEGIIDFYFNFFFLGQQDDRSPTFQLNSSCPLSAWYQGFISLFFSFCQGQAGTRAPHIYILVRDSNPCFTFSFFFFLFSSSFFVLPSRCDRVVSLQVRLRGGRGEIVRGVEREKRGKGKIQLYFVSSRRSSSRLSSWSLNLEPLGVLSQIVGDVTNGFRSAKLDTPTLSAIAFFDCSSRIFLRKQSVLKTSFKPLRDYPLSRRKQYSLKLSRSCSPIENVAGDPTSTVKDDRPMTELRKRGIRTERKIKGDRPKNDRQEKNQRI